MWPDYSRSQLFDAVQSKGPIYRSATKLHATSRGQKCQRGTNTLFRVIAANIVVNLHLKQVGLQVCQEGIRGLLFIVVVVARCNLPGNFYIDLKHKSI